MKSRRVITITRRPRVRVTAIPSGRRSFYARLGATIAAARIDMMMTQADLARRVKLSRGSVANIETGRQQMLVHQASAFARVLKIDKGNFLP